MGFFYQAIKRATGQPVEEASENEAATSPAFETVPLAAAASASALGHTMAQPLDGAASAKPRSSAISRQLLRLQNPIEMLVAFLSPPVIDENIIAMEQCRVVRTRLLEVVRARKVKTLLVTSAIPAEGKTVLSVNLAVALSQLEGVRVLLVDADLRKPTIAQFLKMNAEKGLSTFLQGTCEFDEICWQITPSLDVCPTLTMAQDTAEALHGSKMQTFLKLATDSHDIVILDAAPLLPVADTQVLAPLLDGAILAVRANQTPGDMVEQAAAILGPKLIGTILNGAKRPAQNRYYTNYVGQRRKSK
jgi:capsular exopolysaccharide synthesis family protein